MPPEEKDEKDDKDLKDKDSKEADDKKSDDASDDDSDPGDESKWDAKTKSYIEKLRKENQSIRAKRKETDAKLQDLNSKYSKVEKTLKKLTGVEDDKEVDAEELQKRVGDLESQLAKKELERIVQKHAIKAGLTEDDTDYFQYKVGQKLEELAEDEEISEEELQALAKKVKARAGGKSGNSSVDDKNKDDKNPDGGEGPTLEQFVRMSTTEKSLLYQKNPNAYNGLWQQAKDKRLI